MICSVGFKIRSDEKSGVIASQTRTGFLWLAAAQLRFAKLARERQIECVNGIIEVACGHKALVFCPLIRLHKTADIDNSM